LWLCGIKRSYFRRTDQSIEVAVKPFTLFAGFLLLTTVVAIPLLLLKKDQRLRFIDDENLRYDINDYMAAEGL